ncbi:MAG: DUF4250 domain-containing protein [Lachnospiraceae bacterium]|nr:DUF4250 domain-containing protein [Lachnospiraceae bacterium]
MNIPNDPMILLSFINTQLRDFYDSLDAFCEAADADADIIKEKLSSVDYEYDPIQNQFV